MNKLLRLTPWLAFGVAVYQIVIVVMMAYVSPGLVIYAGLVVASTLFIGATLTTICHVAFGRKYPSRADRSRHAMGWMLLSCIPTWPTLLIDALGAGVGLWLDTSIALIVAALVVREIEHGHARWLVPLVLAVCVGFLSMDARELAIGCSLVALVLVLHAVAVMPKETP